MFPENPLLRLSKESRALRYYTKEEVRNLQIPITHSDIVEDLFLNT